MINQNNMELQSLEMGYETDNINNFTYLFILIMINVEGDNYRLLLELGLGFKSPELEFKSS